MPASQTNPVTLDLLRRLVGFDTTSRNSNLALIAWVRDYLAEHDVESELVPSADGAKANLYATIGPPDRAGIMLSGHTDVVPIDGQDWRTDPFELTERDDLVYGRGTADMKGFIAAVLAMVPAFQGRTLATPIHLAFSYDEEVGCLGVRRLIDRLADRPVRPAGCIIGEPTEMKVVRAHKGKISYLCEVRGFECHSSLAHTGVNAVEYAAEIIALLRRMAGERRDQGPLDQAYAPPYTTVHTGLVSGGTALNIVPKDCRFEFEWRYLPEDDPAALYQRVRDLAMDVLEPEMRAIHDGAAITITELSDMPGFDTPEDAEITTMVKALAGANDSGKVSFGTEAGLFNDAEIPTIVCGPGNVEQAHKPNEFISRSQLAACDAFLGRLLDRLSAD